MTKVVIATTHIDRRNERLSKDALTSLAKQINEGDTAIVYTVEHDSSIPPLGKVLHAEVREREDGEFEVTAIQEEFEGIEWLPAESGYKLFRQKSKDDTRPFKNRSESMDDVSIHLDLQNFESQKAVAEYVRGVQEDSEITFTPQFFGRKSLVPDPEVVISVVGFLGKLLGTLWLVKKTKTGEKFDELAAEESEKFYRFVRSLVVKGAKYLKPANRPTTYVFIIAKDPSIEFIAVTNDGSRVISAITLEKVISALQGHSEVLDRFNPSRIQFILDDDGSWRFNYLLTKTGEIIGTERSLARRTRRIQLLNDQQRTNFLVQKSVDKLLGKSKKA